MNIPGFLARQFYVAGSLRNTATGWELQAQNPMGSGTLVGVGKMRVDGRDIPLVWEGRRVRLQFEGWPAVQFTGWPSVAVGTFPATVALIDSTDDGKGRFRIVVVPDDGVPWPSPRFLRQGVRVEGWVLLGRVRLGYEIWRQFNGFPPIAALSEPGAPSVGLKGGGK